MIFSICNGFSSCLDTFEKQNLNIARSKQRNRTSQYAGEATLAFEFQGNHNNMRITERVKTTHNIVRLLFKRSMTSTLSSMIKKDIFNFQEATSVGIVSTLLLNFVESNACKSIFYAPPLSKFIKEDARSHQNSLPFSG